MADNKARVHIEVTGDASGAEVVGKELDSVAKKADSAGSKLQGGFGKKLESLFPTFSKVGKAGGSMLSGILSKINPAAAGMTILTVAVGAVMKAFNDAKAAEDAFLASAGEGFDATKSKMEDIIPAQDAFKANLDAISTAIKAQATAMKEGEAAIAKRLADEEKLAESATRLAIAQIKGQEARGEIDAEESQRRQAEVSEDASEDDFARKAEAANAILKEREKHYAQIKKQAEEIARQEAEVRAKAEALDSGSVRDRAAAIDPRLNTDIKNANDALIANTRDSATTPVDAANAAAGAVAGANPLEQITGVAAYKAWKAASDEAKAAAEAAERAAESEAEFQKAQAARAEAINRESEAVKADLDALEKAKADAAAAEASARKQVAEARNNAGSYEAGGVEYTVDQRNRQARNEVNSKGPTPPPDQGGVDEAAFGVYRAAPNNASAAELAKILADGMQRGEQKLVQELIIELKQSDARLNASAVSEINRLAAEVQKLTEQNRELAARL